MIGLLALAADGHEAELAIELEGLHERNELPNLPVLLEHLAPRVSVVPAVRIILPQLTAYDTLIAVTS